jgi:outer membrane protein assembly factor BamB
MVYVTDEHHVYGVHGTSARLVWTVRLDGPEGSIFRDGSLFVFGFFGCARLDPANGAIRWVVRVEGGVRAPVEVSGATLYFSGWTGSIGAVRIATGQKLWEKEISQRELFGINVLSGRIIVGSLDNVIYCIDSKDGNVRWTFNTRNENWTIPLMVDSLCIIGSNDSCLYGLNAVSGKEAWRRNIFGTVSVVCRFAAEEIYTSTLSGNVCFINPANGTVRLKKKFDFGDMRCVPLVDGQRFFVGSGWPDNSLYEVSLSSVKVIRSWKFKGPVYGTPVKYEKCILINVNERTGIGSQQGRVYKIRSSEQKQ